MCNCLKEKKDALLEKKDNFPELKDREIEDAYFKNTGWLMDESSLTDLQLFIPFVYEYSVTAKSGRVTKKKKEVSMTIGYCPFCGEKVEK